MQRYKMCLKIKHLFYKNVPIMPFFKTFSDFFVPFLGIRQGNRENNCS